MPYQPHRGNPESKQYFVVNNLIGGMNTLSADDVISTIEAREVLNMDLSGSGALVKRKGFKYSDILNNWISELSPTFLPDGDIYFLKVIKNEGNISKYLEEFSDWSEFRNFIRTRAYSFIILMAYATGEADELGRRTIKVDLIKFINDEDLTIISGGGFGTTTFQTTFNAAPDGDDFQDAVTDSLDGGDFTDSSGIVNIVTFNSVYPETAGLTNIDVVSFLGKHYLLLNQLSKSINGILEIDEPQIDTFTHRIINNNNVANIYKPTPLDIALTNTLGGYNMLYTSPLEFVKNHTFIRAIHRVYITSIGGDDLFENISIPTDGRFRLNIVFSGTGVDINSFEFDFFSEDAFGNRTNVPYVANFDPFTHSQSTIDDAIASYRIELDLTNFSNSNTITTEVRLIKSEEPIVPVKEFSSEIALQDYFIDKDYYLISTEPIAYASQEQSVENAYHILKERNATSYNFIDRELMVYRENEPKLLNYDRTLSSTTDLYVLKSDDNIYEMHTRHRNELTGTDPTPASQYNDATYKIEQDLYFGSGQSANSVAHAFVDSKLYKVRDETIFKLNLYQGSSQGSTFVETQYYEITESDVEVGSIFVDSSYIQESDITAAGVVQTPLLSNVIPKLEEAGNNDTGDIYGINDRLLTTDDTTYYRYNGGNSATFGGDFEFFIEEINTSINKAIEYPIKDETTAPVIGIDFDGARILEIEGRLVAYKGNTIWFSDYRRFNYFPSNTYFNLSLTTDDEITSINYFRGSYIVFTRKMIWKMRGNLDQNNIEFQILNDSIGCISPKSVKPFNNTLVFMSRDGLYRIKQNFYLDGLENVEKIDKRIIDVLPEYSSNYESMLYNEQYLLYIRDEHQYDVLRYYYNINLGSSGSPFVVDKFAQKPEHIFEVSGTLYAVKDRRFWIYDEEYTDFLPTYTSYTTTDKENATYKTRLQLPNFSFGYPTHEKKFKNIFLKTFTETTAPLYITIKIDGYEYATPYHFKVTRDADGIIQYDFTLDIESTELGSFVIGEHELGSSDVNQHKVIVGGKGKNITLILEQESDSYFGLTNIGYLFKLGKVRGDI
jgi:hypothetical protein